MKLTEAGFREDLKSRGKTPKDGDLGEGALGRRGKAGLVIHRSRDLSQAREACPELLESTRHSARVYFVQSSLHLQFVSWAVIFTLKCCEYSTRSRFSWNVLPSQAA